MEGKKRTGIMWVSVLGGILAALILVFGTVRNGRSASADTEKAVRAVSLLYLDELAGRREQVLEDIFKDADTALYQVKQNGRCGTAVYGETTQETSSP